jgi:hypothetical protein
MSCRESDSDEVEELPGEGSTGLPAYVFNAISDPILHRVWFHRDESPVVLRF